MMTGSSSIGDLARSFQLTRANSQLKSRLSTLTQEAATGRHGDVSRALRGELGRLAQVESRLTTLQNYRQNAAAAALEFKAMQDALGSVQQVVETTGAAILSGSMTNDATSVEVNSRQATVNLAAVVGYLNVEVGGRFMMSGTSTRTAAVADADTLMSAVRGAISGAATADHIAAAVDRWFDAPAGGGGFVDTVYRGSNSGSATLSVAPEVTVKRELSAADPALRSVLKGLVLASLASDGATSSLGQSQRDELLRMGGQQLTASADGMTAARARVGAIQQRVEEADTRNTNEQTSLQLARSGLLATDPYETATALDEAEANMQNLYALTVRLSRLSLTDYL